MNNTYLLRHGMRAFLAVILLVIPVGPLVAATYTVTNTSGNENQQGSLPWALFQAYWSSGNDRIVFNIPGSGPHVITSTSPYALAVGDVSSGNMVIDGTTQPGYSGRPLIVLNGNGRSAVMNVVGSNNVIRGLAVYNYSDVGIALLALGPGALGGHTVESCWLGFAPSGNGYVTNNQFGYPYSIGLGIEVPYCTVQYNTVSGVYNGVTMGRDPVFDPEFASNYWISHSCYIASNKFGTTPDGEGVLGNLSDGIFLGHGATYNHIAYNVFGGNQSAGVELLGSSGVVNYVYGNFIGVSPSGGNIGNGELGVLIGNRSNGNYIGNWVANYVYYNGLGGVAIGLEFPATGTSGDAHYNYVNYNWIYANNNGAGAGVGVSITGSSYYNSVVGNIIFGHAQHGVIVSKAYSNYTYYNYLGYYVANNGFGGYSQFSAWNQFFGNAFGSNYLGSYGSLSASDYFY